MRATSLPRLSADLPIVIDVVDSRERLERMLAELDAMTGGGLVTMERVRVIRHEQGGR